MASEKTDPKAQAGPAWDAYGGMMLIEAGKKRSGKKNMVLAIQVIRVLTEADAVAVAKAHPSLKFVKRRASQRQGVEQMKGKER